jgi:hypothetical protein
MSLGKRSLAGNYIHVMATCLSEAVQFSISTMRRLEERRGMYCAQLPETEIVRNTVDRRLEPANESNQRAPDSIG